MTFDRLEGRRHAVDVLGLVSGKPSAEVIANMRAAWANKPGEYAQGIRDVLDLLGMMAELEHAQ